MRRRYRKIYEDFRPIFMWWKEMLLLRKLLFAVIVSIFSTRIEAQVWRDSA